jgi:hypothetical protein
MPCTIIQAKSTNEIDRSIDRSFLLLSFCLPETIQELLARRGRLGLCTSIVLELDSALLDLVDTSRTYHGYCVGMRGRYASLA